MQQQQQWRQQMQPPPWQLQQQKATGAADATATNAEQPKAGTNVHAHGNVAALGWMLGLWTLLLASSGRRALAARAGAAEPK